jgi:class 3 adenylate cyclase
MRINIRTKLFVLMVGLTGVMLGFVLVAVEGILSEAINAKIVHDFNKTQKVFRQVQALRYDRLLESSVLIGENPAFKGNLQVGDPASLEYIIEYEFAQLTVDLDLFIVTDREGKVLAGYNAPEGIEVHQRPSVQRALRGEYGDYLIGGDGWPELMAIEDKLYLISVVPVYLGDSVIGTITQGVQIDQQEVDRFQESDAAIDVTVVLDDRLVATTVSPLSQVDLDVFCAGHRDSLDNVLAEMRPGMPFRAPLAGVPVFAYVSPLGEGERAFFVATVPEAYEFAILNTLDQVTRWAAVAALVVTLLLAYLLGNRLSRPILRLVEGMNRVEEGDLNVAVRATTHDEISLLTDAFNRMTVGMRERMQLMRYVGSHTQDMIHKNVGGQVNLGGTREVLAVMFTDIRGFTAFSEKRQPEEVISMLNRYLGFQAEIVPRFEGSIDKFVGDEMVALFIGEHALERAIDCAIEIQRCVCKEHETDPVPIDVGIGINYGPVILGNMGAENRLDYTVIGAEVNLGARLCQAAAPKEILVLERLLAGLEKQVRVVEIKKMAFKGFTEELAVASLASGEEA